MWSIMLYVKIKTLGKSVNRTKLRFVYTTLLCYTMDSTQIGEMTSSSSTHRHIKTVKDLIDHLTETEEVHMERVIKKNALEWDQRVKRWFGEKNTENLREQSLFSRE